MTVTEITVPGASTVKEAGVITGDCHVPPAGFAELVSVTVHELPTGTSVAADRPSAVQTTVPENESSKLRPPASR
ncbi:hypothetical protein [Microbacterium lacticum]|uniref:hypothetical protein n=1 Tax=Microbacterium lacticum TaxID=33885 RepID=UPI00242AC891|nr:hypothetical protein [Microbacterium lacticum]